MKQAQAIINTWEADDPASSRYATKRKEEVYGTS